jgi:alpha-tubulin suppressor-like RCC1 family protein
VLSDETAHCWGDNDSGQVGSGAVETFDGCIWNGSYQSWLGTETQCDGFGGSWEPITKNASPINAVAVLGLSGVIQITTRDFHTCAVMVDGSARCWGANNDGRLGDGTTTSRATPVEATGIDGNPGWPASVTVTATSGSSSTTVNLTLTKS